MIGNKSGGQAVAGVLQEEVSVSAMSSSDKLTNLIEKTGRAS